MGIDPMTHRPRTDVLASLPHLIALTNLAGLMNCRQNQWDDDSVRMQFMQSEVVQMANFQNLLLQSTAIAAAAEAATTQTGYPIEPADVTTNNAENNVTMNTTTELRHLPHLQISLGDDSKQPFVGNNTINEPNEYCSGLSTQLISPDSTQISGGNNIIKGEPCCASSADYGRICAIDGNDAMTATATLSSFWPEVDGNDQFCLNDNFIYEYEY